MRIDSIRVESLTSLPRTELPPTVSQNPLRQIDGRALSCYFDMVLAHPAVYLGVNTVLLLAVFTINSVLYVLTWRRIRQEACSIQLSVGRSQLVAASHVAAKNLHALRHRWWVLGVLPIWQKFAPPPFWFVQLTTTFTNLGGCLNLLVYARIRRRKPPTPPVAIVGRPFENSQQSSGGT
ncbi:hypothetical protein FJT64_008845 [Amphibalanus amphitrite]|uniref:Uncharacterized protein n=1 Tax=Amphibalanus amphitrite TaxID=1232801 RepID=A0A6A4VV22_AMPAM|nr:hypothetical protein FJT64_008845 [Amphibalanus amphitrite]